MHSSLIDHWHIYVDNPCAWCSKKRAKKCCENEYTLWQFDRWHFLSWEKSTMDFSRIVTCFSVIELTSWRIFTTTLHTVICDCIQEGNDTKGILCLNERDGNLGISWIPLISLRNNTHILHDIIENTTLLLYSDGLVAPKIAKETYK